MSFSWPGKGGIAPYGWQSLGSPSAHAESYATRWYKGGVSEHAGEKGFGKPLRWSDSKNPPWWEPSLETRGYPFRIWIQDVNLWLAGTELQPELVGPAVARRLGGTCAELVRMLDPDELRNGRQDPNTGVIDSGFTILIRGLERRHGQYAIETSTKAIVDMLKFRRGASESASR